MGKRYILLCLICATVCLTFSAIAQERANSAGSSGAAAPASAQETPSASALTHTSARSKAAPDASEARALRLEGEKRFRTNCGRCHQPPHKFPPRVMAAAIRHMRVRAMITDEDMRLILRYMTQ
jgi:mono/diheme cytochrome c family protein